ncbi:hypothetical protein J5N97_021787 [Dioscorea zingiberensis]|uniref:TF-B3 domain-containing protein n=1 Tax=Dioscorea zingiberensis TaxID=325984 RepID=A0A9D5HA90_9LILI|nr:hypothetical protein J5N97_021787 [Dioscorea zingiberensis]
MEFSRREGDQEDEKPSSVLPPAEMIIEKEHMFDKVVTPSDVGKLNRLVIPKQHAEKYFPLDISSNDKGLLLSFEDRSGKPWRFRYSYWNSSQSYVMTKGWSRFVKEKRLDAGDTISFGRGVGEAGRDRLFIDWKRRPDTVDPRRQLPHHHHVSHHHHLVMPFSSSTRSFTPWGYGYITSPHPPPPPPISSSSSSYVYNVTSPSSSSGQYLLFRSGEALSQAPVHVGMGGDPTVSSPMVLDSVPVVHSKGSAKRVRLFGVNLDCPQDHHPSPSIHLQLGRSEPSVPSPADDQQQTSDLEN